MAVTKIRKISSWTLVACTVVTLVVLGLFYFGGDDEPYKEMWNPHYTDLYIYWMYILFALAAAAAVLFGIWQFISNFKDNPKGGVMGLVVLVLFFGLLFVTYAIGGDTPLPVMNSEAQEFNVPFWLKLTDMWLYSTYTLTGLVIIAIFAGSLKKIFNK